MVKKGVASKIAIATILLSIMFVSLGCLDPVAVCGELKTQYGEQDGKVHGKFCLPGQSPELQEWADRLGQPKPANSAAVEITCNAGDLFTAWFVDTGASKITDCPNGCLISSSGDSVQCLGAAGEAQGTIAVKVTSGQGALEGAKVEFLKEDNTELLPAVMTNADGFANFALQVNLKYKLKISKEGYQTIAESTVRTVEETYREIPILMAKS